MTKPFAVIFDMDGVIIDSNPYHKISLRQFASRHGYTLSEQELKERIFGRTNRQWLLNLFGNIPNEQIRRYADEKEGLFREIFRPHCKPVKGLLSFLEMLDQQGIPRAVATSAPPANVSYTLELTQTGKYFPVILDDTFVTNGKPHPEIYLKASAALEMDPSNCIVIEDSLSGIAAGKAAGCKVIGITTTHSAEELYDADFVIDDFENLGLDKLNEIVS
ncbi:MAG: HAD family phosphatase [Bacteroidetes bacterium]|nr:HAD family phosphatase [Bacteroidota bacterium]